MVFVTRWFKGTIITIFLSLTQLKKYLKKQVSEIYGPNNNSLQEVFCKISSPFVFLAVASFLVDELEY